MPYRSTRKPMNGIPAGYRKYAEPHSKSLCCCGCPNIFAVILLYGMLAIVFMIVFICFSASSGRQYERDKDPFSSKTFYQRKTKEDIELYKPKEEKGEHIEILRRRLTDLTDGYRDIKDLKKKYYNHCKTCSVVTSSGRLLFHQAGEEIDSAECVIRMNNAPVVGYEEYVGKKTTSRIVCFRSVANLKKSMLTGRGFTKEVVVWGAENPSHGRWAMSKLKMFLRQYLQTKWFSLKDGGEEIANAIFESETGISREKSHTWLSTGLFTMLFALQTCDNITVYGMVDENYCKLHKEIEAPYHYYENLPWNECEFLNMHENKMKQGHRYLTEKALYRRFASMFNLNFKYPAWNLTNASHVDFKSPFREKYMKEHTKR
ncbi:alpha-N-acetyl-neuraminyl-2,3-beta-galactosyl-1,3-N-acetyl-galactosaminide alpha-2,6-sialyltransferase-like isoform X1 [Lytechinus pictus]|uniref:alpha-N-acetyl-neuraminyl-2,3-beta-galactosyl-1, 3-N-acetyl-galactosaminide alpha-2,6-sialyltransferase-like isoform X1 n=1 Tax=Lytechinus pictus TaxID=7653 RepID=UPI0030BA03FA